MSEIAFKTQDIKRQPLNARSIHELVFLGCASEISSNVIFNIPKAALVGKSQNDLLEVKSLRIGDQAGNSIPKWTEKYNIDIGGATAWMKLNGVSSPGVPRPISIMGGVPDDNYDDAGAFIPSSPIQLNDSGDGSKILLSGIGTSVVTFFTNLQPEAPAIPHSATALWPSLARQIYIDNNGFIAIFVGVRLDGAGTHRPLFLYSKDGGINFTVIDVDDTFAGMCFSTSFIVDKYGNYHLVWVQSSDVDTGHRYMAHRKYSPAFAPLTAVTQISEVNSNWAYDATIQIKNDGTTTAMMWTAGGHSSDPYDLYYRERTEAGTLSAIATITSDAVRLTKDYRCPSLGFDSSGYRHILFQSQCTNVSPAYANVHYIYETGAGLQAMQQVNNDNANDVYDTSNIIVDEKDTVWVAYSVDKDGTECKLYLKNIKAGSIGARTLIEDGGGANVGAVSPQIQQLPNKSLLLIYNTLTALFQISSRIVSQALVVGTRNVLYTQAAGYDNAFPHMPYGIYPNVYNIRSNVPQQGTLVLFLKATLPGYTPADLQMVGTSNLVMGATASPINIVSRNTNIRGAISKTKFNNLANLAIT